MAASLDLLQPATREDLIEEDAIEDGHPPGRRREPSRLRTASDRITSITRERSRSWGQRAAQVWQPTQSQGWSDRSGLIAAELQMAEYLMRKHVSPACHGTACRAVPALVTAKWILPRGLGHQGAQTRQRTRHHPPPHPSWRSGAFVIYFTMYDRS